MAPSRVHLEGGVSTDSHSRCAHLTSLGHRELGDSHGENRSLLQGGRLQTESLTVSESSKGLQRAGLSNHFLARECVTLSFFTGPV